MLVMPMKTCCTDLKVDALIVPIFPCHLPSVGKIAMSES